MRGKVILLIAVITIQVSVIKAQEELVWINTIEEFKFSSPTDSIPVKKEENFHLESDTSTNYHYTYYWDNSYNDWISESKSIGIFDREANSLEMQHFTWDGVSSWIGLVRYVFWYDTKGEIHNYRSDSWDHFKNIWIKQDSLTERWESDGLLKISKEFKWNIGSKFWEPTESRKLEKNIEGNILIELESVVDINGESWVPVSRSVFPFYGEGNLEQKSVWFWLVNKEEWFEYLRYEISHDSSLDMRMEERYEWDFLNSGWSLRFRGGVSDKERQASSYIIGLRDDSFQKWQVYEMVESKWDDDRKLVTGSTTTYKNSDYGDWIKKSQTRNFYTKEAQPMRVEHFNWISESDAFEVDSKKYFYYPETEIPTNIEVVESKYSIFPNPTSSSLHIMGPVELMRVDIFDLQGKMIMSSDQMVIDVSYLSAGLYMIRILGEDGTLTHLRFIKI